MYPPSLPDPSWIHQYTSWIHKYISSFGLDVFDKVVKAVALGLGGFWTLWNYQKSRPYTQKFEFELGGSVFVRDGLCVEMDMSFKNVGAAKHVNAGESFCILTAIRHELPDKQLHVFRVFLDNEQIEPGEKITHSQVWRIPPDLPGFDWHDVVWLKIELKVFSGKTRYYAPHHIRVHGVAEGHDPQAAAEEEGDSC